MGTAENFCLRWNDFESNVSGSFRELRAESDFFDCTLACDESSGRTLQAHKVILSACSSFFKQMLRNTAAASPGHSNPLIYLRGVRLTDLESVLDFMYHGEVNVAHDDLNSFLAVAEDLQIKGLTQQQSAKDGLNDGIKKSHGGGRKSAAALSGFPSAVKRFRRDKPLVEVDGEDVKAPVASIKIKNELDGFAGAPSTSGGTGNGGSDAADIFDDGGISEGAAGASAYEEDAYDNGSFGYNEESGDAEEAGLLGHSEVGDEEQDDSTKDIDAMVASMLDRVSQPHARYSCLVCGMQFRDKTDASRHVEGKHVHLKLRCSFCPTVLNSRHNLKTHCRKFHE